MVIGIVVLIIGLCSAFILYGGVEMFFEELQKINEPLADSLGFIFLGGIKKFFAVKDDFICRFAVIFVHKIFGQSFKIGMRIFHIFGFKIDFECIHIAI